MTVDYRPRTSARRTSWKPWTSSFTIATLAADSDMPEKYSKRVTDSWEKIKGAPMEVLETTEKNLQNHLNNAREEKKNKEKVAKVVKDNQDK